MSTAVTMEDEALIKNQFVMNVKGLDRWADLKKLSNFQKQVIRSVVVFHSKGRGSSKLFITTEDEIYGIGENGHDTNILGLTGQYYQCEKVEYPVLVEDLSGKDIRVISVGDYVGAALGCDGTLYWWGNCAALENKIMPPHPVTKSPNLKFTNITCGSRYVAAISSRDEVFVWGKLEGDTMFMSHYRVSLHEVVKKIASGKTHLAMLTDKGEVFTWGCNEVGQRGYEPHCNKKYDYVVRKLQFSQVCKDIACGFSSMLCLSSSGDVWACGENPKSWGLACDGPYLTKVEKMTLSCKVTRLVVGWGHVDGVYQSMYIAIATNDKKFVWNDSDGPGLPVSSPMIDLFYENTSPRDIMYTVLYPHPNQYCVKCCKCLSPNQMKRVTEEMQRKLDVINEIVAEIVRDLEHAETSKRLTLDAQKAEAALTPNSCVILKDTNSVATQTEIQVLLETT